MSRALAARGQAFGTTLKVVLLLSGIWGGVFPGLLWVLGLALNA
jgi:hypothetical protein